MAKGDDPRVIIVHPAYCSGSKSPDQAGKSLVFPDLRRPAVQVLAEGNPGYLWEYRTTGLMDVYEYAERVTSRGFVFMDTPGYDPVSITGQVAGR